MSMTLSTRGCCQRTDRMSQDGNELETFHSRLRSQRSPRSKALRPEPPYGAFPAVSVNPSTGCHLLRRPARLRDQPASNPYGQSLVCSYMAFASAMTSRSPRDISAPVLGPGCSNMARTIWRLHTSPGPSHRTTGTQRCT